MNLINIHVYIWLFTCSNIKSFSVFCEGQTSYFMYHFVTDIYIPALRCQTCAV